MPARDIQKEQVWRERLADQRVSGLSMRAYCQRHNLNLHTFVGWKRIIATRDQLARIPAFLPVDVVDRPRDNLSTPLILQFPNGVHIEVSADCHRGLLADVIGMLTRGGPC